MEPMPKKSDFLLLCLVQTRQPVLEPWRRRRRRR
jgi:hypothetical protein